VAPTVHLLDILTALVIFGAAAALVWVAIVIGRRVEARGASLAASGAAEERLAGPSERRDLGGIGAAAFDALVDATPPSYPRAFLVLGEQAHARPVVPWTAPSPKDARTLEIHPHASTYEWSRAESDGLVDLFRVGFRLDELAAETGIGPSSIVEELARRVFGATEPVIDHRARRFGQPWTAAEMRTLDSSIVAGLPVPDIARQLGRDQLSVVFRILGSAAETATLQSAGRNVREAALHR
jgi:hypothetical protein